MDPERLARIREKEQQAAGAVVGAKDFVFLREHDGELEKTVALTGAVCRVIRERRPDLVLTQDPWREYQLHPDHRVAGWCALDGIIAARDHLFFREQLRGGTKKLEHHRVRRVLLFGTAEPNVWFDISSTLERKIRAIGSHTSQVRDIKELGGRMRAFAAGTGGAWGLTAAEGFRYLELA
jgi:LmbE family N-acetylglucosaminyl deacetylase